MVELIHRTEADIKQHWVGVDPLVTINCIVYNHAHYIHDALNGFLMQVTNFPFEILVHDDCSTDDSQTIIRNYQARYPTIIRTIFQTENQYSKGERIFFRFMFPNSRGTYIALCEGDDYWISPDKLQRQIDWMRRYPECALSFHGSYDTNRIIYPTPKEFKIFSPLEVIQADGGLCPTASIMFRSEIMKSVPESIYSAPIDDYFIQVLGSIGGGILYFPERMSVYRSFLSGSWSETIRQAQDAIAFRYRFIESLQRLQPELPESCQPAIDSQIGTQLSMIAFIYSETLNFSKYTISKEQAKKYPKPTNRVSRFMYRVPQVKLLNWLSFYFFYILGKYLSGRKHRNFQHSFETTQRSVSKIDQSALVVVTESHPKKELNGQTVRLNQLIANSSYQHVYIYCFGQTRESFSEVIADTVVHYQKLPEQPESFKSFLSKLNPLMPGYVQRGSNLENRKTFTKIMTVHPEADLVIQGFSLIRYVPRNWKEKYQILWDLIDSPSLHYRIKATQKGNWIYRFYYRLESERFKLFEKKYSHRVHRISVVSPLDQSHTHAKNVVVNTNGVDIHTFYPLQSITQDLKNPIRLLFIGTMSYPPNIDSVTYTLQRLLPFLNRPYRFQVVGVNCPDSLQQLIDDNPYAEYLGFVNDILPLYQHTDLLIAPMISGSGIKNKVLEAMACGKTVLGTALTFNGIPAEPNPVYLQCDSAAEMIRTINELQEALPANHIRSYITEHFSSAYKVAQFEAYVRTACQTLEP